MHSPARWSLAVAVSLGIGLISTTGARAEDRDMAFVHALQSKMYADTAIDFLNTQKDKPDGSAELKDVWLLEMSKSVRAAAAADPDPANREKLSNEAVKYLQEFAKEKPNHPAAVEVGLTTASMTMDQANELLAAARVAANDKDKAAKLTQAREYFEKAAPLLQRGIADMTARLTKMQPPKASPQSKAMKTYLDDRAKVEWQGSYATGQLALLNYYIAQTYPAPTEVEQRKAALSKAYKALDEDIYQRYRGEDPNNALGYLALQAHAWTGKVAEELGDLNLAKSIYEEVLENFTEPDADNPKAFKYQKTAADDILVRTKHFQILLHLKDPKDGVKNYEAAARAFLSNDQYRKALKDLWGYQAASYEFAKYLAQKAEKETKPEDKREATKEALKIAGEMATVRSEFQRDALELRRKIGGSGKEDAQSEDEAALLAGEAIQKKDYEAAAKFYTKALDFAEKDKSADLEKKRPGRIAKYKEAIAWCQFQPSVDEYKKIRLGKETTVEQYTTAFDAFTKVAADNKKTDVAKQASSLAVDAAAICYSTLADKSRSAPKNQQDAVKKDQDAARARLQQAVDYVLTNYPGTPAADESLLSLGQAYQFGDRDNDNAIKTYEKISPNFERYFKVLQDTAKLHYIRYYTEKQKGEQGKADQMKEDLAKAKEQFQAELKTLLDKPKEAPPEAIIEAKLLLAQLHYELKEYAEVAQTLKDLLAAIDKNNPPQLDKNMLQVFQLAMRSYMAMGDFKNAAETGDVLIAIGPDNADINNTLVSFVLGLDKERQRVQNELNALPDSAPGSQTEPLRASISSMKNMLLKMLDAMQKRSELQPASMVYIGQLFSDMDETDLAREQFRAFLSKVESDAEYAKQAGTLVTKVRAKQIDLLRKIGKFEEAADQAEKQCKANPRALDFLILRAQIYQSWAGKDKQPTWTEKYDKAIGYWSDIRKGLESKKPPQYYDAVYNIGACLRDQGKRLATSDKEAATKKLVTASKVLNSVLDFTPKLNGDPDNIKRYAELKKDIDKLRTSLGDKVAAPEPAATNKGA